MLYKLKGIRVANGITQKKMAEELGVTVQYLNRVEKGLVDPRRSLMIKISKALNTPVQELFFNEE